MVIPQLTIPLVIAIHDVDFKSTGILRTHLGDFMDLATEASAESRSAVADNDTTSSSHWSRFGTPRSVAEVSQPSWPTRSPRRWAPREALHSYIKAKQIPVVKIGQRTLIRFADLSEFLDRRLVV